MNLQLLFELALDILILFCVTFIASVVTPSFIAGSMALLISSYILYMMATGAREGYTWAIGKVDTLTHLKLITENCIITTTHRKNHYSLDYHTWRLIENASIVGIIFGTYRLYPYLSTWEVILSFPLFYLTFGILYQIFLNHVFHFPKEVYLDKDKNTYTFLNITIPYKWYFYIIQLVVGLIILTYKIVIIVKNYY